MVKQIEIYSQKLKFFIFQISLVLTTTTKFANEKYPLLFKSNPEFSTSSIDTVGGLDFRNFQNEVVTFSTEQRLRSVTITVFDDVIVEGYEWFSVVLSNPTQGELGDTPCASVAIQDDDCKYCMVIIMLL